MTSKINKNPIDYHVFEKKTVFQKSDEIQDVFTKIFVCVTTNCVSVIKNTYLFAYTSFFNTVLSIPRSFFFHKITVFLFCPSPFPCRTVVIFLCDVLDPSFLNLHLPSGFFYYKREPDSSR